MLPITHGSYPVDKLVPVTQLWASKRGTGTLWGRLTETMRVFLFPEQKGMRKARLALMEKSDIVWYTLCCLEEKSYGWCGVFGLSYVKVKKNPKAKDQAHDSWSLYLSPFYGEAA